MAKGFTLIEILIVISIIGILTAVAIPRFVDTSSITAEQAAEMVRADIRKTQDLAMADSVSHQIAFISGSGSYTIDSGASAQTISLPSGVKINTTKTIIFSTDGKPDATAVINVSGATTVTVVANTGRVTIP